LQLLRFSRRFSPGNGGPLAAKLVARGAVRFARTASAGANPQNSGRAAIGLPGWAFRPYFPAKGNIGFRSGWAYDGGAVVVPWTGPKTAMEIRNEGAPFRCLGLHTHGKAPMEAQARFSEES